MLSLNDRLKPHVDVVDTKLEDAELALLNLESKTYFTLNSSGALIWAGIKAGRTLLEISKRLQDEFEVSTEQAERSVLALAADLVEQALAERE